MRILPRVRSLFLSIRFHSVCQPFTAEIELDVNIQYERFSCEIEQIGHYIAILFACCILGGYRAKFVMWDVITQEQVAVSSFQTMDGCLLRPSGRFKNITSLEYRSFVFLDHRRVLFGAICHEPDWDGGLMDCPFLEIIDPTSPTRPTKLELDKRIVMRRSEHTAVDINVWSSASCEGSSLSGDEEIPFISEMSRGVISVEVCCRNRGARVEDDNVPRYEAYVFILNIEDVLSMVPLNGEQRCIEWKDLSSSAATFSYASMDSYDRYGIFTRHSYVVGYRYVSPIQPLDSEDPTGARCFFVYDFNPHRETSDPLPSATPEGPDPETGYHKRASETLWEVVGGLSCWRMRFDLPAAGEDVERCHVALTDGGVVLFEVRCLIPSCGRFYIDMRSFKAQRFGRSDHSFLDVVIYGWNVYCAPVVFLGID